LVRYGISKRYTETSILDLAVSAFDTMYRRASSVEAYWVFDLPISSGISVSSHVTNDREHYIQEA
jgi:hypothetical protein